MKYGMCLSRYLPRSRQRGNEFGRMEHRKRLLVVVTSGVMAPWMGKDGAGESGSGWV